MNMKNVYEYIGKVSSLTVLISCVMILLGTVVSGQSDFGLKTQSFFLILAFSAVFFLLGALKKINGIKPYIYRIIHMTGSSAAAFLCFYLPYSIESRANSSRGLVVAVLIFVLYLVIWGISVPISKAVRRTSQKQENTK